VTATAEVDGRRVASATLEFAVVVDKAHAERLRDAVRVLRASPIDAAGTGGAA
jgi:hypothetical protein